MKLAIYARRACRDSGSNLMEDQIRSLRTWAEANGHAVVQEHADDGFSGNTLDRPGLKAVRRAVAAGEVEGVLISMPDRLSRSPEGLAFLFDEIRSRGIRVLTPENACVEDAAAGRREWTPCSRIEGTEEVR